MYSDGAHVLRVTVRESEMHFGSRLNYWDFLARLCRHSKRKRCGCVNPCNPLTLCIMVTLIIGKLYFVPVSSTKCRGYCVSEFTKIYSLCCSRRNLFHLRMVLFHRSVVSRFLDNFTSSREYYSIRLSVICLLKFASTKIRYF